VFDSKLSIISSARVSAAAGPAFSGACTFIWKMPL